MDSRVLYVAMTRAKCFLYMTHAAMRRRWDDYDKPLISRFLYDLPTSSYQKSTPVWNATIRQWVATVLRKHYVEEKTLRLEDGGKTFESQDDSESALDQPSTQTSLLDVKTHGIIPSFASAINLLSSEHQLHQHQPHQRQKEKQYSISKNTPHSSFSFSRPTLTISTSISIPKPYNSPSTTLSKYQDQLTNGIGHKQQRNNTTTSSHHLIKNESPNMHESLTTKLGQKRNMNYFDGIQQSGKTNKINKKRTIESSEFNIEQIVTKAIQGVAVGKNSFSLDEVVIKAQKENIENDQAVTIQNQVIKQLDNLVKTGALWKTKKNGSIRFLVAE
ncbi:uncharacterized protein BX664DRAFT_143614 [Halteromyces radiatus]|uniref:uncharacterized protein n=1 Tax=Halteromyces radiatus TaxID=101107 RepID=UPI00221EAFDD|nr:uncharacterized protein BX664DRAFT_143614 [Halteromyces radiatus]KAI8089877.1 hypothetical protein BX664DRAFT_143614 [Halteromyces radiatus]